MSEALWGEPCGLVITGYAGPKRPDLEPRRRIQISALGEHGWTWAQLDMEQWRSLCRAVEALGPEADGRNPVDSQSEHRRDF